MKFRSLLVVALAATLSLSAFAAKKTKKTNKKVAQPVMIKPVNGADFSYAAGLLAWLNTLLNVLVWIQLT